MDTLNNQTCPNCHEKEVELAFELEINGKVKKVCEECWCGYKTETEEDFDL